MNKFKRNYSDMELDYWTHLNYFITQIFKKINALNIPMEEDDCDECNNIIGVNEDLFKEINYLNEPYETKVCFECVGECELYLPIKEVSKYDQNGAICKECDGYLDEKK